MYIAIISPVLQFDIIAWMIYLDYKEKSVQVTVSRQPLLQKPDLYLLIGHQFIKDTIPTPYGIYQWEPWKSKSFLRRMDLLENAKFIWDYSRCNIPHYPTTINAEYKAFKLTTVPWDLWDNFIKNEPEIPLDVSIIGSNKTDTIDVLMIGSITRDRMWILRRIANLGMRVAWCKNGLWGSRLKEWMLKAKIILNLHRLDCKIMELARILPAIGLGCNVISEPGDDPELNEELKKYIKFIFFNKDTPLRTDLFLKKAHTVK